VAPSYHNVDFSILKDTEIRENVRLQLRAEIFNLFNHPAAQETFNWR
jgi:hypothetical protein